MKKISKIIAGLSAVLLSSAPIHAASGATPAPASKTNPNKPADLPATADPAKAAADFIARTNAELLDLYTQSARADWVQATYITDDTDALSSAASEKLMEYTTKAILEAAQYQGKSKDPTIERALLLLRLSTSMPAPKDDAKRKELADIAAKLNGMYGKGEYCPPAPKGKKAAKTAPACMNLDQLSEIIAESRDYDKLTEAWLGWHNIAKPMRSGYQRYVELVNQGSQEIGFKNTAELWQSKYDMAPADFEKATEKLWQQVKPLYQSLHCYAENRLETVYKDKIGDDGLIPAQLLGNMWAQEWGNIYPLLEPYKNQSNLDVSAELKKQKYDAIKMTKTGENFFTSLGLKELPKTFYERSMLVRPRDRDVICHASAWDVTSRGDLRIKMCIQPTEDDLTTIHHELGHIYYYQNYYNLPVLFQSGANDGFHEAIGDAIALSITPEYLQKIGLLKNVPKNEKGLINVQMKRAIDKVAFLPFGLLVDKWRWGVFSGQIKPGEYNKAWWELRQKYQGVKSPVSRTEEDFDPGAKYHIPSNTPYMRYFLAHVLQFQFHKALCDAAGWKGPLHACSIYGSKEAGARLQKMLELGASKPWPDALYELTGQREMSAEPILEYFAPLKQWLDEQNKGKKCGWNG